MDVRYPNKGRLGDPEPNVPTDDEIALAYELRRRLELRLLEPTAQAIDRFGAQHHHWAELYDP